MADFFVSYTSSDRDWAFWIGKELEKLGHTSHVHEWEIPAGGNIAAWMQTRHDKADHILCVLSRVYLTKDYSSWEMQAAQWAAASKRPNFALPVYVEKCEAPTLLALFKRCDLYNLDEDEARVALAAYLAPAAPPPGPVPFPGRAKPSETPARAPAAVPFPGKRPEAPDARTEAAGAAPVSAPSVVVPAQAPAAPSHPAARPKDDRPGGSAGRARQGDPRSGSARRRAGRARHGQDDHGACGGSRQARHRTLRQEPAVLRQLRASAGRRRPVAPPRGRSRPPRLRRGAGGRSENRRRLRGGANSGDPRQSGDAVAQRRGRDRGSDREAGGDRRAQARHHHSRRAARTFPAKAPSPCRTSNGSATATPAPSSCAAPATSLPPTPPCPGCLTRSTATRYRSSCSPPTPQASQT